MIFFRCACFVIVFFFMNFVFAFFTSLFLPNFFCSYTFLKIKIALVIVSSSYYTFISAKTYLIDTRIHTACSATIASVAKVFLRYKQKKKSLMKKKKKQKFREPAQNPPSIGGTMHTTTTTTTAKRISRRNTITTTKWC